VPEAGVLQGQQVAGQPLRLIAFVLLQRSQEGLGTSLVDTTEVILGSNTRVGVGHRACVPHPRRARNLSSNRFATGNALKLLEVTDGGQACLDEKRRPPELAKNGIQRDPASQYQVGQAAGRRFIGGRWAYWNPGRVNAPLGFIVAAAAIMPLHLSY
jgi:hypothetical protein